jgi:hypothetical protein
MVIYMMSMVKRRRGSYAHSRLYWRVKYFYTQYGGVNIDRDYVPSVWCKQFLQRHGIEVVYE